MRTKLRKVLRKPYWLCMRFLWYCWVSIYKLKLLFIYHINPRRIEISVGSGIKKHTRIIPVRNSGNITIGEKTILHDYSKIILAGGNIYIGEHTTIGERITINCFADIRIGDDVMFADGTNIITNTHNYIDITRPVCMQGGDALPIDIGDGSWIGINVTFLAGSSIGKNCVVGAGAVVRGEFPDYSVIAGVPAKIIKKYNFETSCWEIQ